MSNKYSRVLIYSLLIISCLASYFSMVNINNQMRQILAKETLSEKNEQNLRAAIAASKILNKKTIDYKSKGVDTSSLDDNFAKIKYYLFVKHNSVAANNLIKNTDQGLDNLLNKYNLVKEQLRLAAEQAEKQRIAQIAEESSKGDLGGNITCAHTKCPGRANLKLLTGTKKILATTTDSNGNYNFHIKAGIYNLSITLTGYQSIYMANIEIVNQKQTKTDFNMSKIVVVQKKASTPGSTNTSATPPVSTPINPPATPPITPPVTPPSSDNMATFLKLINDYRTANHLGLLTYNSKLTEAAQKHSDWMLATGNFSHTGQNGSSPWARCSAAGTYCSGEIIAYNYSITGAFTAWQNSPGHNAIMLGSSYKSIGLGIAGNFYTVDFQ